MALVRQSSFHGGEVSPSLHSRTDLPSRAAAVRTMRNFVPTPTGAAMNRAGFQFISEVKDSTKKTRLIPFTFSTSQSYVLEFGDLYVRFIQGGGYIVPSGVGAYAAGTTYAQDAYVTSAAVTYRSLQAGNVGHAPASSPTYWTPCSVLEVTTPYTEAQLARLQYVQSGDTLTIVHPSHEPRELKRLSASSWSLGTFSVVRLASPPASITFLTTLQQTDDPTHQARGWDWVVTSVVNGEESLPSPVKSPPGTGLVVVAADRHVVLTCAAVAGATQYHWYRGRYGVWGYVGNSTTVYFMDEGQVPNYSDRPPTQRDPFASSEYPAVATYHQQRLAFASQPSFPQRVVTSRVGAFKNFDYSLPQKDDDAIDFTVASRQYEEVRALVSLRHLLILTANTEFACDGGDRPLSPTNINLVPASSNGCSWLRPLVINNVVLYLQSQQASVREFSYDAKVAGWGGGDVSLAANHFLSASNRTIVDWTYQRLPHSVVWAVRDDGKLLSLTYARELEVAAWAQHDTDGLFESVCSISEGAEDALYAVVRRTVGGVQHRYVERMATRQVLLAELGCFLDASIWYDGVPASTFGDLGYIEGKQVLALVDGQVQGPFTVAGGTVTLTTPGSTVFIGLPYDADIELLDLDSSAREMHAEEKNVSKVIWEVDRTAGLQAGESLTELVPWVAPLGYTMPASGVATEQFVVPVASSWNRGGRAALRQSYPLPVTVLGASRDVELGDA